MKFYFWLHLANSQFSIRNPEQGASANLKHTEQQEAKNQCFDVHSQLLDTRSCCHYTIDRNQASYNSRFGYLCWIVVKFFCYISKYKYSVTLCLHCCGFSFRSTMAFDLATTYFVQFNDRVITVIIPEDRKEYRKSIVFLFLCSMCPFDTKQCKARASEREREEKQPDQRPKIQNEE